METQKEVTPELFALLVKTVLAGCSTCGGTGTVSLPGIPAGILLDPELYPAEPPSEWPCPTCTELRKATE